MLSLPAKGFTYHHIQPLYIKDCGLVFWKTKSSDTYLKFNSVKMTMKQCLRCYFADEKKNCQLFEIGKNTHIPFVKNTVTILLLAVEMAAHV